MAISRTSFLSDILGAERIPIGKLAYFRARLSNKIHELVLLEFARLERENKITKAELARKIGRKPEQVTRWLGAAGNWEIETLSDLLLGMGCEPSLSLTRLAEYAQAPSAEMQPQLASVHAPEILPSASRRLSYVRPTKLQDMQTKRRELGGLIDAPAVSGIEQQPREMVA